MASYKIYIRMDLVLIVNPRQFRVINYNGIRNQTIELELCTKVAKLCLAMRFLTLELVLIQVLWRNFPYFVEKNLKVAFRFYIEI